MDKAITRASEIINAKRGYINGGLEFVTLTLVDEEGYPTSSAISLSKADGINWLSFLSSTDSNKARRIAKNNKASVNISTYDYNINLVGTIEIVTDVETKQQHWQQIFAENHGAVDCPDHCALVFTTKRYSIYFIDDDSNAEGTI